MSVARKEKTHVLSGPFGIKAVLVLGAIRGREGIEQMLSKLSEIDDLLGTTTQVFDASAVAGSVHLISGTLSALIAQAEGWNFTQSLKLEVLCHVAVDKQITRAIKKVGVKPGTEKLAFVVMGESTRKIRKAVEEIFSKLNLKRDDSAVELNRKKRAELVQKYYISPFELECSSIEDSILERISLLSLS